MDDAFKTMDRMYRLQRYFYDATRKYYLLGRDRLLDEMEINPEESVLEVGCGTARNLIILAKRYPSASFYGLDASAAMLQTARSKIAASRAPNITLRTALADDFEHQKTFALNEPFGKIFFSYSISMIPSWRNAIENSLSNLPSGGRLYIVDFYDFEGLPRLFQKLLKWWLIKFNVQFWEDLMPFLDSLETDGRFGVSIRPLFNRYSFIASIQVR